MQSSILSSSRTFSSPPKEIPYTLTPHCPHLQPLRIYYNAFNLMDMPILDISYKRNHTIFVLLYLSSLP